jgi:hypothetical protein
MKKLIFLFALMLISCNNEGEETRIFTVTTNAIPPEGGTVTLENSLEVTGQYKLGDVAIIKAKPSSGYIFQNFTANVYFGGPIGNGGTGPNVVKEITSIEIRCYESTFCSDKIILNGHFVKED